MKYLTDFKRIRILNSSPFIPYNSIHKDLIDLTQIQKELCIIKRSINKSPLPYSSPNRSYLLKAAKLFGVKLTFKHVKIDQECSGLCWPKENKIQVILKEDFNYNKRILTHELGHILQIKLGLYEQKDKILLSEELKCEQQAETLSYYLCKILWPKERFEKKSFDCYFEEDDIIWLHNFYKKDKDVMYINDLFEYI